MSDLALPRAGEARATAEVLARLPSVDRLLAQPALAALVASHGHAFVKRAIQDALGAARERIRAGAEAPAFDALSGDAAARVHALAAPRMTPVFNLTGTVIHTNLGRALLADEAIDAVAAAMRGYAALEYDVATGGRGDRDAIVEDLLRELTGAEAATVVNNCAAAVLLALKALAAKKEVLISRGELIEIGGSFRMPDIMKAAGCKLVEVGTTNRTHARDFESAFGPKTGLVAKAHTSNYAVTGFTASVDEAELARIAHAHGVPFIVDLGSGALIDLSVYGLPKEPLPQEALAAGADLVMFSGDKLLGGPQAGIVVGRREPIARIKRDPLKRALRVSKLTLAALEATLRVYASGHRLPERLPTLALLARERNDIRATAERLKPALQAAVGDAFAVTVEDCASQIGSGAQPIERLPSAALAVRAPAKAKGRVIESLEKRLRGLPVPVVGRVHDGALWLDCRCLLPGDEPRFVDNLRTVRPLSPAPLPQGEGGGSSNDRPQADR
ncbi:L-seryl-tRNA(Sec) selenium transferase [Betaproteobacteria bacterium PRO7]|jgi:L-seryl-tRNA(Ser) seleniumtransferase|nr:L-seryl-tRNA(Sec) selenium transferase [Betaproteobacteria bacterium PRO7]